MSGKGWSIRIADDAEQRQEGTVWGADELSGGEAKALQEMGVADGAEVRLVELSNMFGEVPKLLRRKENREGLVMFAYFDDYGWVLYADGVLKGAYYCSSRGCAWQSEWVVETAEGRKFGWGNNLVDNEWCKGEKFGEGESELGSIPADFIAVAEGRKRDQEI